MRLKKQTNFFFIMYTQRSFIVELFMNPDIETIDFFQWEMDIQVFGFHFYVCKARVLLDSSEII